MRLWPLFLHAAVKRRERSAAEHSVSASNNGDGKEERGDDDDEDRNDGRSRDNGRGGEYSKEWKAVLTLSDAMHLLCLVVNRRASSGNPCGGSGEG